MCVFSLSLSLCTVSVSYVKISVVFAKNSDDFDGGVELMLEPMCIVQRICLAYTAHTHIRWKIANDRKTF